ncbi:MAG: 60S ribosomal export protein NMD3 [Heliobacteriaceae bacterium]|jgi:hypothetical protein|nr:60S ribosomal export protein NMD3 [Heliobacteriaceae bacterium]
MYVNKCIKCGREFETKNPKRVICPDCLYSDKEIADIPKAPSEDEPPRYYSAGGGEETRSYNRGNSGGYRQNQGGQNQGGYNQGGYNRPNNQNNYNRGNNGGGYRQNQGGGYNQGSRPNNQGGYNQGGYNRPNSQGGYNQGNSGGYRQNQGGGYNQGGQGGYNRDNNSGYNRSGGNYRPNNRPQGRFQNNRRPMNKNNAHRQLLVSREQLEQIELLYKLMLPLPNPDAHEVIGAKIELEPRKVFFGINLVRQKMMLPKLPFPKRKLAISSDQMFAIKNLYEPLLPLPPIGCHKIIASQLKMDEWRVHVGIGLIRSQMGLQRWNQERDDLPPEYKIRKQDEKTEKTEKPKKTTKKVKEKKTEELAEDKPEKPKRGRKKVEK